MLKPFESNILKKDLFNREDKLLLALSGGVDSVVLAYLLKKLNYNFEMAHCNFKLRDVDSDQDEEFCKQLAKKLNVIIHTKQFNTLAYSKNEKLSIQMAARELRYAWFKQLKQQTDTHYILTAHHANDVIETVFINLLRGTGIKGLTGIPEKNDGIVRPLLFASKTDIESFAKEHKLKFRVDKSNLEDIYERNFLRMHIIPQLKKLRPSFESIFITNTQHFLEEWTLLNKTLTERWTKVTQGNNAELRLNREDLLKEDQLQTLLHFGLNGFGFNETQVANITECVKNNRQAGKVFHSKTHTLTSTTKQLVIQVKQSITFSSLQLNNLAALQSCSMLKCSTLKKFKKPNQRDLILAPDALHYPLTIRSVEKGDKIVPFGMKGFKLISDFMKDLKLNSFEKKLCKVLVNGNGDIMWLIGYRSDNRFRVAENSTNLIKLTVVENQSYTF